MTTSLAIYVAHNTITAAKMADKKFGRTTTSILILYAPETGLYTIKHYRSTVKQVEPPALNECCGFALLEVLLQAQMQALQVDPNEVLLCIDGNLGTRGAERLSGLFDLWLLKFNPTRLVIFSNTEGCREAGKSYCQENHARFIATRVVESTGPHLQAAVGEIGFFDKRSKSLEAPDPKRTSRALELQAESLGATSSKS